MYEIKADLTMEDLMELASEGEIPEVIKKKLARAATTRIANEFKDTERKRNRKVSRFAITVTGTETFELDDSQIWPDLIPEDPCAADVKRVMKDYGTPEDVVSDWGLWVNPEWSIKVIQIS